MKNKLITAVAAFFLMTAVLAAVTASSAFARGYGVASGWDAVTFDDSIIFSAVLQNDGSVKTDWSKYDHAESFTYYKVVRSQTNANPVYPDDGYIYYGGDVNVLTYTDNEAPEGTSYYRICQIGSPARYCSKVVTIVKGAATIVPDPVTVVEPVKEAPVPTLYEEPAVEMVSGFNDVPVDNFAADCLVKLGADGIVESGTDVSFRPDSAINRAEFLKLVMTAYYPDTSGYGGEHCFTDVGSPAWFAPYVCEANKQSIVTGYSDNYFRPGRSISRAEGAAMLVKALHVPVVAWESMTFKDVIAEWQKTVVAMAFKKGLVNGYNELQFGPNDLLTRAQAAKLICNARDNFTAPLEGEVPVIDQPAPSMPNDFAKPADTSLPLIGTANRSGPIIIDHRDIDLSKVPESYITSAKSTFKIAYGHTSHGSQITTGMDMLKSSSGLYNFDSDGGTGVLYYNESLLSGDLGSDWEAQTRALLNRAGNDINMVMWSWCGQLSSMSVEEVNAYLSAMDQLEKDFPNVTFVYITGHLDGTGTVGTLNRNNETIRTFAKTYSKVLFDFADIESYDPAGNYFLDLGANDNNDYSDGNWAQNWCAINPGSALCAINSCAHSQSLNCNLKGRAFWWMMARLAGWGG